MTLPRMLAEQITVTGQVQGVGFRPFIYRLAKQCELTGWVQNRQGQVEIWIEGTADSIDSFARAIVTEAPPLASPIIERRESGKTTQHTDFVIRDSSATGNSDIHVPADQFTCDDCLHELNEPSDRRYRYPFINCTQCGPRYTLIESLPYDRPNTSMAGFPLCTACRDEYEAPDDRRFHAEPIACPECGPQLEYQSEELTLTETEAALQACTKALREGKIVAVKGIGGYHLLCDARSESAVKRLREKKHRPGKPLAVLFPASGDKGLDLVVQELAPCQLGVDSLTAPQRPIVLCRRRADSTLAPNIAPGLNEIGAMLPYSPLHHLLVNDFGGPLVATSGNVSGEPVITDNEEAEQRLNPLADAFLHHNRPILRPADDAVIRVIDNQPRLIRPGRGIAPLELSLPCRLESPTLAVGGQMKNTIALAWDDRVVISPHIGDLDSPRSQSIFEQVIGDLQRLYGVTAEQVTCDAHPAYASSRWARNSSLPVKEVYHHHAHASALYGEYCGEGDWLVFTWDGVGYGPDGTLWGGEALLGRPGQWRRFASLRPFRLPGGEKASREPWRSALALCWEAGMEWSSTQEQDALLRHAWEKDLNCAQTSAAGRLFDSAAALLGVCHRASFEGEGPMLLEALAEKETAGAIIELPLSVDTDGVVLVDWSPLLPMLLDGKESKEGRAMNFHKSLAHTITEITRMAGSQHGIDTVGLGGGVFQNSLLYRLCADYIVGEGMNLKLAQQIPANDGGLSYGQIIEFCSST